MDSRHSSKAKRATPLQGVLLILLGLSLLAALEGILRLAGPLDDRQSGDPFVGFSGQNPLYERYRDDHGVLRARTTDNKRLWFNRIDFRVEKPSNLFRVFTLGGSTAYGRPYGNPTSFSGWLDQLLNHDISSSRRFEVLNAGGISYASYRVVVVLEEILDYDPDLVVVYTGHNEFLESRTYPQFFGKSTYWIEARDLVSRLRLYRLLKGAVDWGRGLAGRGWEEPAETESQGLLKPEVEALLDRSAGLRYYQRDTLYARRVFEHYRYNIARMIDLCGERDVPVLFLEPVDNLRDFSPFKSTPAADIGSSERMELQSLLSRGKTLLGEGKAGRALPLLERAARIDRLFADTWFTLGRALLNSGDTTGAAPALLEAREQDVCPLRAKEAIHRILREETGRAGTELIDLPEVFAEYAPGGIIGSESLVDHIHPSPEFNLLIAGRIAEWMSGQGCLAGGRLPDGETTRGIYRNVMSGLSREYFSRGVLNLAKVLVWANKFSETRGLLSRHWNDVSGITEAHYLMGVVLDRTGHYREALPYYEHVLDEMPENRQAYEMLARNYERLGMIEEALGLYEKGLEKFPDYMVLLNNYGILLARSGRSEEARSYFDRAKKVNPDSPDLYNNIGMLHSMNRHYGAAIEAFEKAVSLEPGNAEAHHNLGLVHLILENNREAERHLREAVRLDPEYSSARNNLGIAFRRTGRFREAEEQFRLAMVLNPGFVDSYLNLALLLRDRGEASAALEIARLGADRFPEEPRLARLVRSLEGRQ